MNRTSIGWTDYTWNPVTGCSHVSAGCEHCYAEAVSHRFRRTTKPWRAQHAAENVRRHGERLEEPLYLRKPSRIFVCSMGDLFHERVPDEFIAHAFAVMALAREHTFQVLTKRPERMRQWFEMWRHGDFELLAADGEHNGFKAPLPNVWLLVSAEDQPTADERIPILLDTPAVVRGVSLEPLLGPVDLSPWLTEGEGLDWVIVGGETGPNCRMMNRDWVYDIQEACVRADVPLFFKQWGGRTPKAGGRELDGREWTEFPGVAA